MPLKLQGLGDVNGENWSQPDWQSAVAVPSALERLAAAYHEKEAWDAYHQFLYAIGNNHAGTYYPVVLATLPFLREILLHGAGC